MTGRRVLLALLALGSLTGCGVVAEDQARPLPSGVVLAPRATPPAPDDTGRSVEELFLVDDGVLRAVHRRVRSATPAVSLRDLLAGPLDVERGRGLSSALPAGLDAAVRQEGAVAVVSLRGALGESGRSDEVLALAQVVATLDATPSVSAVRFEQDGQPLSVPRSDGSLTSRPVQVSDYAGLLPAPAPDASPTP